MDNEQLPSTDDSQVPSENQPIAKHTFWRTRRWAILTLIVVVIVGGSLVIVLAKDKKPASQIATSTISTNHTSNIASSSPSQGNNNHWKSTVNAASLPLGDGHVSTAPEVGYVDSCTTNFKGAGARHSGSWINATNNTWDSEAKLVVEGSVNWSNASYSDTTSGNDRILTTNDLPENYPTGNFPISRSDPAYQYDSNPNHIAAQSLNYALPLNPVAAASPGCLPLGPIGVLSDGVTLFNALDAAGRDAGAHEIQDLCDGHPNGQDMYHYHSISSCILKNATGSSTLVGYALDGYGIYVERDASGNLPTNADLDACHGRTSPVMWNGKLISIYHYDATLEYPYTLGCFHGTAAVGRGGQQ